ncbi:AI-2E family transporter [Selenomonas sp. AB3002]|uniref:AI-2E family transporter n=1 Tax=Selenomonas sp. AB3002 TaxID=1392502 RepID=UPI000496E17B
MRIRAYRTSIILGFVSALLISAFWYTQQLAFIIFLSLLLNLLLNPLVDKLSRKLPRGLAAGLVMFFFLLAGTAILTLVSSNFLPTFTRFIREFPHIAAKLQDTWIVYGPSFLKDELDTLWESLRDASLDALKGSMTLMFSAFSKFIDMVIIFFVTFYLLKDGEKIKSYLAGLFPHQDNKRVMRLFNNILGALRIYICGQMAICCITATVVFLYFTIRNLPYASVFAVVSGVAEFIPVLGPTVASAFGVLLTATTSPLTALQTAGFYLVLTQVNHNLVMPNIIGKTLNLHPIAIILGVVLGGELLGAAGMFLAVPIIVICKLVIADIYLARQQDMEKMKTSRWLSKPTEEDRP